MKRVILILSVALLSTMFAPVYGQGFFDKLTKGLDKASKNLDKALGTTSEEVTTISEVSASKPTEADILKPVNFPLKNLPINILNESLAMTNPTVISSTEDPEIEDFAYVGATITLVEMTDKYTRVDCSYTNERQPPEYSIAVSLEDDYIEIADKKYRLLTFSGISEKELWVKFGKTVNYTLVYESIPAKTTSFYLSGGGFEFSTVKIKTN